MSRFHLFPDPLMHIDSLQPNTRLYPTEKDFLSLTHPVSGCQQKELKMRPLRPFLSFIVLILIVFAPAPSFGLATGITTADLRVRDAPNGTQIDSLRAGSTIGVIDLSGAWVNVVYLNSSGSRNPKTGWISLAYVRITGGGIGGDDCETEYDTDAEVCVEVSNSSLDCRKDRSSGYIRGCEVLVEYEVTTDYSGGSYLNVDIECEVAIRYQQQGRSSWRSDSMDETGNHGLYAHASDSESLSFDFSFSSSREVTKVQVESVSCEIYDVNFW